MTGLACLASLSAVVTSLSLFCNILQCNTADALIVNAHRCPALRKSTGLQGKPKHVSLLSYGSRTGAGQGDHLEQGPLKVASCGPTDSPRMSFYCQDLQVTVSPVDSTIHSIPVSVTISLSSFDHDAGIHRTWTTTRAEPEFAALGVRLKKVLGADCVPTPPLPYSSPAVLEGYLQQVLELPDALRLPLVNDFLELPAHMAPEPVLSGEVREKLRLFVSSRMCNHGRNIPNRPLSMVHVPQPQREPLGVSSPPSIPANLEHFGRERCARFTRICSSWLGDSDPATADGCPSVRGRDLKRLKL